MCELHTQLVLSERLGFIDHLQYKKIQEHLDDIQRMAVSFKNKLDTNI